MIIKFFTYGAICQLNYKSFSEINSNLENSDSDTGFPIQNHEHIFNIRLIYRLPTQRISALVDEHFQPFS